MVGEFISTGKDEKPRAVGVPCTAAAVQLGEAAASGDFLLDNRPKDLVTPATVTKLGDGWALTEIEQLDAGFPGPLETVRRDWADQPLFELTLRDGVMRARRNGYVFEPAELDRLVATVLAAGKVVRDVAMQASAPQPFSAPLPAPDWPEGGYSASLAHPPEPWLISLRALAADVRMTLEDPVAYVRAFPSQPVPGRPFAVLRGAVPGVPVEGRLVFHTERSLRTHNLGRTAIVLPAPEGAADRPRERRDGVDHAIRDGLVATWQSRSSTTAGDVGDLQGLVAKAAEFYPG